MMSMTALVVACVLTAGPALEGPTSVTIEGQEYGASADETGPIGGGRGYTRMVTSGDLVAENLDQLIDALAKAKAGQVVFIPGEIEIDCTARVYIEELVLVVPGGVTLAGTRGQDGSQGALLFSDALKTSPLIRADGPDVRVTGLRIRGPVARRYDDHHRRSFQEGRGHTYYYKLPTSRGISTEFPGLEVDNCELSAFSQSAVFLAKEERHHIHHCYIHHCQYAGLGYGVSIDLAVAIIEHNLFDYNRHSIAGTGRAGSGYEARHNIELGTSSSHCFDMHGGRDRKDGTDIAGTRILIHHNTFLAPNAPAIAIRGVPEIECDVYRNWFPRHADGQAAVRAGDRTRVHENAFGKEPARVEP